MQIFEKFKEHASRALTLASHAETGNEELVRYYQTILHHFGFKTQIQEVKHSMEGLSRRQLNLIGFTSDTLVDRSTRKGVLFINPLDTALSSTRNPSRMDDEYLLGPGSVQGKIDYLCRIYGALDLLDQRHKNPLYLVGTAASHRGMMGSRFLIDSLAVHPKEVFVFAPTQLRSCKKSPGHLSFSVELDSPTRNRDARGYNRVVEIRAKGESYDFSTPRESVNAMDLLLELLLGAAQAGFDFQWSDLRLGGAEACVPDLAYSKIFLTAFQYEDFKQFVQERTQTPNLQGRFEIDFLGVSEEGTQFLPTELIEVILELDHEWRKMLDALNSFENDDFEYPLSSGALTRIQPQGVGKWGLQFELRFLPQHQLQELQGHWKHTVRSVLEKHQLFHFQIKLNAQVPGVDQSDPESQKNTNYMTDAGFFDQARFPVTLMGAGNVLDYPKSQKEQIKWSELERAIVVYRDLMREVSQS